MKIEHFVWYPEEGSGYIESPQASSDCEPSLYKDYFLEYLPVQHNFGKDAWMLFSKSNKEQYLLTKITDTKDEFNRDVKKHHSAVLNFGDDIDLFDVYDSMDKFDKKKIQPEGKIRPLKVEEKDIDSLLRLKKMVTPEALKTTGKYLNKNKRNKIQFRCEHFNQDELNKLTLLLFDYFVLKKRVRKLSVTSTRPRRKHQFESLFDLVVRNRTFTPIRNKKYWSFVDHKR